MPILAHPGFVVSLFALAVGCGGSVGDTSSDAGGTDSETSAPCNDVAVGGAVVETVAVPAVLPTFAGGTIADGTYDLVTMEEYSGVGGKSGKTGGTLRETIVVSGGVWQAAVSANGGDVQHLTARVTPAATTLSITATCGGAMPPSYGFDASATGLRIGGATGASSVVLTFTRRS
jgi:hypothetical protein